MSLPVQAAVPRRGFPAAAAPVALGIAVAVATGAAAALGGGVLALAPALLVTGAYALIKLPLRVSASALLIAMLAVDDTAETHGQWRTPLAIIGDLVHARLDEVIGVPIPVTGMEIVIVALMAVVAYRRSTGSTVDTVGQVPPARALRSLVALYVAGVIFSELVGLSRGLGLVPWKLRNLLHPVLLTLFFLEAFRPGDGQLIGRIVVFAACCRSVLALIVQNIGQAQTGGNWETATSHGDSVLFAVAAFVLIMGFLERPDPRRLGQLLLPLPLVLLGCMANERRIVWVMLAMSLGVAYLITPMRGWKLAVTRGVMLTIPVLALYVGVGWEREGKIFSPVRTLRSVADTSMDHSAYWREVEIWNIATSMQANPLTGMGLGGEYVESMENDDISGFYKEYREWPHNTVLGLLMLMGLFAFTAHWVLLPSAMYFAVRAFRATADPDLRMAALGCIGAVVSCLVMAYGDTGAHYPQHKVFAALAIAFSAKLVMVTGAWPANPTRSRVAQWTGSLRRKASSPSANDSHE